MAHKLGSTRQTGGIRHFQSSEFSKTFSHERLRFPLKPPNHPRYLNTEFVGHTYPTRNQSINRYGLHEHMLATAFTSSTRSNRNMPADRLVRVRHKPTATSAPAIASGYHGVTDIFREPKPAAGFYNRNAISAEEVVLEPAFPLGAWRRVHRLHEKHGCCSIVDHLKFYIAEKLVAEVDPNRTRIRHLRYPPFVADWKRLSSSGAICDRRLHPRQEGN